MAIFSRRTLQRLADENATFLSKKQTRKHVDGLNRMNKERSLATEWEVAVINALSKLGNVVHEKDFGGSSRGDIYFEAKSNPTERFLADITTISTKDDPLETLWDELRRIVEKRGLRMNAFNLRVGAVKELDDRVGSRVRLKVPGRSRFVQLIFNDPTQTFSSSGTYLNLNPDYVQQYPLTHNRLYSAMERKAYQLKRTNFNGPLGIIVCDSDNSLLSKVSSAGLSRTTDEIVYSFLEEEQAISFVILVGVHHLWADYIDIPHWARDKERYEVAFYLFKGKL